jgi:hypothetical protein
LQLLEFHGVSPLCLPRALASLMFRFKRQARISRLSKQDLAAYGFTPVTILQ